MKLSYPAYFISKFQSFYAQKTQLLSFNKTRSCFKQGLDLIVFLTMKNKGQSHHLLGHVGVLSWSTVDLLKWGYQH